MSFKLKRERPCITPGMPSTSSGFTYKPHIASINKAQQFYFRSNNSFVFIFGLPTLVNHKKRTREHGLSEIHEARKGPGRLHETSDKYTCFQKIVLLFRRITVISKIYNQQNALYISKNYNQQNRSLHLRKLQSTNSHSRKKTTRKTKGKPKKEKKWEERYNIRNGT